LISAEKGVSQALQLASSRLVGLRCYHTGRESRCPALGSRLGLATCDGLGDGRVPRRVEVSSRTAVRHADAVTSCFEVLAVERLADIPDKLRVYPNG